VQAAQLYPRDSGVAEANIELILRLKPIHSLVMPNRYCDDQRSVFV